MPFNVDVIRNKPNRARVWVTGEVDIATAPALDDAFELIFEPGVDIVVDLAGVYLFDAAGLNVLARLAGRLRDATGSLVVQHASPLVRREFVICGLAHLLSAS
ncbi:MAG TPA: STAS domain-containing protein [Acidimicrobiales bacterium]|jgi:anti-anti-sigma factor